MASRVPGVSGALVLLALGVVLIASAGCGSSVTATSAQASGAATPKPGGTYNFPLGANPWSIEPLGVQESVGYTVAHQIFEGLTSWQTTADGSTVARPDIAESWTVNGDGTEYTFKLRHGVTFQPPVNREVTAQDFVDCWNYVTDPKHPAAASYVLAPVLGCDDGGQQSDPARGLYGVSAPDASTLVVRLRFPFAEFPEVVGHVVTAVWPVDYRAEVGAKAFKAGPVGTGPYLVKAWRPNQYVDLIRNPDWWEGEAGGPYIDTLHMPIITSQDSTWLEFQKGDLDATGVPLAVVPTASSMPQVKSGEWTAKAYPTLSIIYIGINWTDADVGGDENLELRKALSYGAVRDEIVNVLEHGVSTAATGVIPAGLPGADRQTLPYPEDAAKARETVQGLGTVPALHLWEGSGANALKEDEALQAGWAAAGLQVKIDSFEWGTYLDMLSKPDGGSQLFGGGWGADYPSVDNFVYTFFDSVTSRMICTFYSNTEVDRLLDQARRTVDDKARLDLYLEAERLAMQDAPVIPISSYRVFMISNNRIGGFAVDTMGQVDMWKLWVK
jgi:oligopeptide transport system substrate-binding protein